MKIAIITFGCKVNQYESEYMAEKLEEEGHVIVPEGLNADVYVINSCAVTNTAERKVQHRIRRIKKQHPKAKVIVVGCYPQLKPEDALRYGADLALGNREKKELHRYINGISSGSFVDKAYWMRNGAVESVFGAYAERTRAYVKVEDGCDRVCSYCAIRLARGTKIRSKPPEKVIDEIERLLDKGHKEVVITGINVGRYGVDIGQRLSDLLWKIEKIKGDFRYRLSSLNPEDVDEEILDVFRNSERICHHLHLSLQSGSDRILRLMKRNYTLADFMRVVDKLREIEELFAITTDVIVGFPTETEDDFMQSVKAVEDALISRVHVFRFSPKEGTPAAKMRGQIPGNIKRDRATHMEEVAKNVARRYRESLVGRKVAVLVERKKDGFSSGYDQYYQLHELYGGIPGRLERVVIVGVTQEGVVSRHDNH